MVNDLHETDDPCVLEYNGERAFALFRLDELQNPVSYEPKAAPLIAPKLPIIALFIGDTG